MTNVDLDFADLATEVTDTASASVTTSNDADQQPTSTSEQAGGDEAPREWPKRIQVANPSDVPDGCVSIPQFAEHMTRLQMRAEFEAAAKGETYEGPTGQVLPQSVYQATKAERNPLPSVIAYAEVTDANGETKVTEKQYIPLQEAEEAWPNRRRGAAALDSEVDPEKIARIAGKRRYDLAQAEERLARLTEKVNRLRELVAKSNSRLPEVGKTWQDAIAAYDAVLADKEKNDSESTSE